MSNPVTPLGPQQTAEREAHSLQEPYPERVLIALDQAVNVDTGGLPDETISSRWARWAHNYHGVRGFLGRMGSRFLNLFQRDHGADAVAGDAARAQRVLDTENDSGIINHD